MSIDKLHLETSVIASLYPKVIVSDRSGEFHALPTANSPEISFAGDNKKHITIIVSTQDHQILADGDMELLTKILKACNLSLGDVALVNAFNNQELNYDTIQKQFKPRYLLFFGVEPHLLGFPLKLLPYNIEVNNNQVHMLASSLPFLQSHNQEKKQLWDCLQQTFLK